MVSKRISAILLAGGQSSRMGTDKAELIIAGKTMIEHQVEKLRRIGIKDIVLSGYSKALPGTKSVRDIIPRCGPLSGIHAGLQVICEQSALVLAVDTPFIPEALLEQLVSEHRGGITVVEAEGRLEPLIGVYDKSLFTACERLLHEKNTSMRALLSTEKSRGISYNGEIPLLANLNTPDEYKLALMNLDTAAETLL